MTGKTLSSGDVTEPIDYAVAAVSQTVTLTRILCWPGAPSCSVL